MSQPFTHVVQWRRKGYWSPGSKFYSEESAQEYGEQRVNKGGEFRVVPIDRHGELTTDQCLVLMKLMHAEPIHWRNRVISYIGKGRKPPASLTPEDAETLALMGQQYPVAKLVKLSEALLRNKLLMADNRERAKELVKPYAAGVVIDQNPEVMLIEEGAFVQAWLFVPHRSEEEERGRQHDIAAYLAGPSRTDVA